MSKCGHHIDKTVHIVVSVRKLDVAACIIVGVLSTNIKSDKKN